MWTSERLSIKRFFILNDSISFIKGPNTAGITRNNIKELQQIVTPFLFIYYCDSQHYSQQILSNFKRTFDMCYKIINLNLFEWRLRLLSTNILYAVKDSIQARNL
jgi:hypothetical protein